MVVKHILVTNDFPPKLGGIQSYLWELWRRLDPADFAILTAIQPGAEDFDRQAGMRIIRLAHRLLLPMPAILAAASRLGDALGARLVVVDPALPLGLGGIRFGRPYVVVAHGAEISVPARLAGSRELLRRVLRGASLVVAAGDWTASVVREAAGEGGPQVAVVAPGVDTARFFPAEEAERNALRAQMGWAEEELVVLSVSRLVPRKGIDVVIEALGGMDLGARLRLVVAGRGRDEGRLRRLAARARLRVDFLGAVSERDLPGLYRAADIFAMCCRNRWWGMEQEGFGVVFLEAAASGIPQVAGRSGGSAEAVADGETGLVVDRPSDPREVARALSVLIDDPELRRRMGEAARRRVLSVFDYSLVARRLADALELAGQLAEAKSRSRASAP